MLHFCHLHDLRSFLDWIHLETNQDIIAMTFLSTNSTGIHIVFKTQAKERKELVKLTHIAQYQPCVFGVVVSREFSLVHRHNVRTSSTEIILVVINPSD
jgi:hypothetical protein